jgi:hypothetical protein
MRIESFHRTFKHDYANGKAMSRIDKCLFMLVRYVRDKIIIGMLIKEERGKVSYTISTIRDRHKTSLSINSSENVIKVTETSWSIKSQSLENTFYSVELVETPCYKVDPIKKCKMICNPCKICIHTYTCSCIDNSIHCVVCKHIHTVVNFTACSTPVLLLNTEIEIEAGPSEINTKFDFHVNQHQTLVEIKSNESKLVHKIQYMSGLIKTKDLDMNLA